MKHLVLAALLSVSTAQAATTVELAKGSIELLPSGTGMSLLNLQAKLPTQGLQPTADQVIALTTLEIRLKPGFTGATVALLVGGAAVDSKTAESDQEQTITLRGPGNGAVGAWALGVRGQAEILSVRATLDVIAKPAATAPESSGSVPGALGGVLPNIVTPTVTPLRKGVLCSMTLNSTEEIETFKSYLPPEEWDYVELAEGSRDFMTAACRRKVNCDILVVSGHFGGSFFGSRGLRLPMETLETKSCDSECNGVLGTPKETWLFGCNTLASKEADHRTADQYRDVLLQDGFTPQQAAEIAAFRYSDYGQTFRSRMTNVFANTPRIYGFSSVGPSGKTVKPVLEGYFRRINRSYGSYRQYFETIDGGANEAFSKAFDWPAAKQAQGSGQLGPEKPYCVISSSSKSKLEKIKYIGEMLNSPQRLSYIPHFEKFLQDLMRDYYLSSAEREELNRIVQNPVLKTDMVKLLDLNGPAYLEVRLRVLGLMKSLKMAQGQELALLAKKAVGLDLSRDITRAQVDSLVSYAVRVAFKPEEIPAERWTDPEFMEILWRSTDMSPELLSKIFSNLNAAGGAAHDLALSTLRNLQQQNRGTLAISKREWLAFFDLNKPWTRAQFNTVYYLQNQLRLSVSEIPAERWNDPQFFSIANRVVDETQTVWHNIVAQRVGAAGLEDRAAEMLNGYLEHGNVSLLPESLRMISDLSQPVRRGRASVLRNLVAKKMLAPFKFSAVPAARWTDRESLVSVAADVIDATDPAWHEFLVKTALDLDNEYAWTLDTLRSLREKKVSLKISEEMQKKATTLSKPLSSVRVALIQVLKPESKYKFDEIPKERWSDSWFLYLLKQEPRRVGDKKMYQKIFDLVWSKETGDIDIAGILTELMPEEGQPASSIAVLTREQQIKVAEAVFARENGTYYTAEALQRLVGGDIFESGDFLTRLMDRYRKVPDYYGTTGLNQATEFVGRLKKLSPEHQKKVVAFFKEFQWVESFRSDSYTSSLFSFWFTLLKKVETLDGATGRTLMRIYESYDRYQSEESDGLLTFILQRFPNTLLADERMLKYLTESVAGGYVSVEKLAVIPGLDDKMLEIASAKLESNGDKWSLLQKFGLGKERIQLKVVRLLREDCFKKPPEREDYYEPYNRRQRCGEMLAALGSDDVKLTGKVREAIGSVYTNAETTVIDRQDFKSQLLTLVPAEKRSEILMAQYDRLSTFQDKADFLNEQGELFGKAIPLRHAQLLKQYCTGAGDPGWSAMQLCEFSATTIAGAKPLGPASEAALKEAFLAAKTTGFHLEARTITSLYGVLTSRSLEDEALLEALKKSILAGHLDTRTGFEDKKSGLPASAKFTGMMLDEAYKGLEKIEKGSENFEWVYENSAMERAIQYLMTASMENAPVQERLAELVSKSKKTRLREKLAWALNERQDLSKKTKQLLAAAWKTETNQGVCGELARASFERPETDGKGCGKYY